MSTHLLDSDGDVNNILDKVIRIEDYVASLEEALLTCSNTYSWQLMRATDPEDLERIKRTYSDHTTRVETRINEKVHHSVSIDLIPILIFCTHLIPKQI